LFTEINKLRCFESRKRRSVDVINCLILIAFRITKISLVWTLFLI